MTIRLFFEKRHAHGRALVLALTCVLVIGVLGGCSAFKSKKRVDMGRVAQDMIAVTGEIQYSLGQKRPVYLRDYRDTPQLASLEYEAERARMLLRGVIDYTIRLVTIGDSNRPEPEKASALADYLQDLLPAVIEARKRSSPPGLKDGSSARRREASRS